MHAATTTSMVTPKTKLHREYQNAHGDQLKDKSKSTMFRNNLHSSKKASHNHTQESFSFRIKD